MSPLHLLLVEWLIVLVGCLSLGWIIHRRYGAAWTVWLWGAAAFLLAEAFRMPLITAALAGISPRLASAPEVVAQGMRIGLLALSAGIFEESARYVLLRWGARDARRWADGLMFGAGHGGIEAIALIGLSLVNAYVLLTAPDLVLARAQATAPEQVEAVRQTIAALQQLTWREVGLALWERAVAMTAHMGLTLLVLRTVLNGQLRWWGLAVTAHALLNVAVLVGFRLGGAVAAEGVGTLAAFGFLELIRRARGWDRPTAPSAPDSPTTA